MLAGVSLTSAFLCSKLFEVHPEVYKAEILFIVLIGSPKKEN